MQTVNYDQVVEELLVVENSNHHEEISTCNRIAQILGWNGPVVISSNILRQSNRNPEVLGRAFKRHHVTVN